MGSGPSGNEHERRIGRLFAQAADQGQFIAVRAVEVHEDDLGQVRPQHRESFCARVGALHRETGRRRKRPHRVTRDRGEGNEQERRSVQCHLVVEAIDIGTVDLSHGTSRRIR